MALDGLGRDGQLLGDVLVGVTRAINRSTWRRARSVGRGRIGDDNGLITCAVLKASRTKPAKRAKDDVAGGDSVDGVDEVGSEMFLVT